MSARNRLPNLPIIGNPSVPIDATLPSDCGFREFRDDLRLREQVRTSRLGVPDRSMDAAGCILDGDGLWPGDLLITLDAAKAGQQIRLFPMHNVAAVQLRS